MSGSTADPAHTAPPNTTLAGGRSSGTVIAAQIANPDNACVRPIMTPPPLLSRH
ncbi:hypothetical protein GCM10027589_51880 [Actinocorallia lasiicapitis]